MPLLYNSTPALNKNILIVLRMTIGPYTCLGKFSTAELHPQPSFLGFLH